MRVTPHFHSSTCNKITPGPSLLSACKCLCRAVEKKRWQKTQESLKLCEDRQERYVLVEREGRLVRTEKRVKKTFTLYHNQGWSDKSDTCLSMLIGFCLNQPWRAKFCILSVARLRIYIIIFELDGCSLTGNTLNNNHTHEYLTYTPYEYECCSPENVNSIKYSHSCHLFIFKVKVNWCVCVCIDR